MLKILGDFSNFIHVKNRDYDGLIQFDLTFEELTYFECEHICFNKPTIFTNSPKLNTLVLNGNEKP